MDNSVENPTEKPAPARQTPAWLAAFLRWGLVILVAFILGAVLITLVFQLPLQHNYKRVSSELESAQAQVTRLTGELEALTTAHEAIQQDLDNAILDQVIQGTLAEVRAARLAIAADDLAGARLALKQASRYLDTLAGLVDKDSLDIVANMLAKANQANADLQNDLEAALPALEQLEANLVSLNISATHR